MNDPKDDYRSTLEAQGWYRDEHGQLTHPLAKALLSWWRGLDPALRERLIAYSERQRTN